MLFKTIILCLLTLILITFCYTAIKSENVDLPKTQLVKVKISTGFLKGYKTVVENFDQKGDYRKAFVFKV